MRIKIVMGFMENGFYGKNRHTLIKQKWKQNSWTILESRERQKQSLCCCVQCSQSSAFLWLLYHLIKTVESLLSATCLFLVTLNATAVFWFSSHYFASSFPPLMTITTWGLMFSGGTTMNSFQTNLLVSWLGKHTLPTTSVSARKCEIHQILL